ncbi:SusC/RagA family TonB-linked outer membrane protein [Apibacter muscae]|uniref:SusC/RagA family TonB-linked outer membrane protein n=1 Tax=Apibacter muscae TaxID=2509004 RepID=A0A563DI09_9FLAO|nr:SusC/RagA family TonB-linked outer membrane protein [Apibacter muscae]TWP29835.1 SusC/RagA family TonB-linked outer membrane protein [Apibacter muscae]TWP30983.1 SusC/RagA family TonB-linked outer membrane protein [Apibacter muscae]
MIKAYNKIILVLCLLLYQSVFGQIKGIIKWEDDSFAKNVEVELLNKNQITQTDNHGYFSFTNSDKGDTLVIARGIKQIILQETDTLINISLERTKLDKIVVLGFINTPYKGAYSIIRDNELESMPQASIDDKLGVIPGVSYSGSGGQPGSATSVIIRGVSSFTGSSNPLYVIDGVPIGKGLDSSSLLDSYSSFSPISNLNPNSIESIVVLKDIAAASMYGAAGANGVILIKTKKGKYNQKTKFNFISEIGFQDIAFDKHQWMNSEQYMDWGAMVYAGKEYIGGRTDAFLNLASYKQQFIENMKKNGWDGETSTNWMKEVQRNKSVVKQYSLNITGGEKNFLFYLGGSYYNNEPLVKGSTFQRYSFNLGLGYRLTEKINLNFNGSITNLNTHTYTQGGSFSSPWSSSWTLLPIYPVYNPDGSFNIQNLGGNQWYNPVELLNSDYLEGDNTTWRSSMSVMYKLNKEIKITSDFGMQYQNLLEKSWWNQNSGNGKSRNGLFQQNKNRVIDYSWTNFMNYKKYLFDKHDLSVDLGISFEEHKRDDQYTSKFDYPEYSKPNLSNGTNILQSLGSDETWRQISYIGRINYTIDKKYTFIAGIRRDGNSTFGKNNKWGNFWDTGFVWNLSNENFINVEKTKINDLKLRLNYGIAGNTPMTEWGKLYYYKTLLKAESYGSGESALYFQSAGNDNLKWEESHQLGIGLYFGIFNNKITGSFDYYNKKTNDLISIVPLPYTVGGANAYYANVGSIRNRGFELVLKSEVINKNKLIWNIEASASYNKSKILRLNIETSDGINLEGYSKALKVGKQAGEYYTWTWAGVDSNTGYGMWYVNDIELETRFKEGKLTASEQAFVNDGKLYYDSKGKLVTTDKSIAKKEFQGSTALPIWQASLYNQLSYKGFTFSILLTGSFDYKVMDAFTNVWMSDGAYAGNRNQESDLLDSWTPQNPNAENPLQIGDLTSTNSMSSRFLRRADHIRLKEVKLSYTFTQNIIKTIGVESITLFIRGTNLFTWAFDKKLKSDPDIYSTGALNEGYPDFYGRGYYDFTSPIMKIYSFGISVNF